jgi:nitric oxide reductase activation protein
LSMRNYKPMQVVILVDCSGSMDTEVDGTYKQRYELAREAALGAAYGLVHAHCDVAVYGHTAETLGNTEVSIFRFKGFKEPITVLSPRLGGIYATSDIMNQNRDGYAVSYVSKKLADKRKRRLLIVISDGQPLASYGYSGTAAIAHSKSVVDGVRKQGIDVLSISITENARRANDVIYGAKNNVFNEDPNVIEGIVKALVTK